MDRHECRRLLDQWDQVAFCEPCRSRPHAERCLEIVAALGYPSDLHARALAIYGSSCRLVGDLSGAEDSYDRALKIYETLGGIDRPLVLDEADLHRRLAYLRMQQQRSEEALRCAGWAVRLFSAAEAHHELGRALSALGWVQLEMGKSKSIATLGRALEYLDADQNPNAKLTALYNLAYAFTVFKDPDPKHLSNVLASLTQARLSTRSRRRPVENRYLAGFRRRTPADALMRFLQGRILVLLGQYEDARRLLETAREDLIRLEMPFDVAAASLELAECFSYFSDRDRWPRIAALCREVLALLAQVPQASEVVAAYQLLERAAARRSLQAIRRQLASARRRVSQR